MNRHDPSQTLSFGQDFHLAVPDLDRVRDVLKVASLDCLAAAVVLKQTQNQPASEPSTERNSSSESPDKIRVLCIVSSRQVQSGRKNGVHLLKLRAVNLKVHTSSQGQSHRFTSYGQLQISRRWPLSSITQVLQHPSERFFTEVFTLYFGGPKSKAFSFRSINHSSCTSLIVRLIQIRGNTLNRRNRCLAERQSHYHADHLDTSNTGRSSNTTVNEMSNTNTDTMNSSATTDSRCDAIGAELLANSVERLAKGISHQADLLQIVQDKYKMGVISEEERNKYYDTCSRARNRLADAINAVCVHQCDPKVLDDILVANEKMCTVMKNTEPQSHSHSYMPFESNVHDRSSAPTFDEFSRGYPGPVDGPEKGMSTSSQEEVSADFVTNSGVYFLDKVSRDLRGGTYATMKASRGGPDKDRVHCMKNSKVMNDTAYNCQDPLSFEYGIGLGAPQAFICPITLDIFSDPVVATDGHTYEVGNTLNNILDRLFQ